LGFDIICVVVVVVVAVIEDVVDVEEDSEEITSGVVVTVSTVEVKAEVVGIDWEDSSDGWLEDVSDISDAESEGLVGRMLSMDLSIVGTIVSSVIEVDVNEGVVERVAIEWVDTELIEYFKEFFE
jgi:hypothetical protein